MIETKPSVFIDFLSHQQLLDFLLRGRKWGRPRRGVKDLAETMRCHVTFVTKVLSEKNTLSLEQADRCAHFFALSQVEKEYFMDLVCMDKAGSQSSKEFYAARLAKQRQEQRRIAEVVKARESTFAGASGLFHSWLSNALLVFVGAREGQSLEAISQRFAVTVETAREAIEPLIAAGLVEQVSGHRYRSLERDFHLGPRDPALMRMHTNARVKILSDLQVRNLEQGVHYTSFVNGSDMDEKRLSDAARASIKPVRDEARELVGDTIYVHCIDFYRIG